MAKQTGPAEKPAENKSTRRRAAKPKAAAGKAKAKGKPGELRELRFDDRAAVLAFAREHGPGRPTGRLDPHLSLTETRSDETLAGVLLSYQTADGLVLWVCVDPAEADAASEAVCGRLLDKAMMKLRSHGRVRFRVVRVRPGSDAAGNNDGEDDAARPDAWLRESARWRGDAA